MKLHVLSDLHIEAAPIAIPQTGADVVVLAGDIHVGNRGVYWAMQTFKDTPVIYVLGNHEFYGGDFVGLVDELKAHAKGSNVHVLENDSIQLDGVRFLGCSLWTDYALYGDVHLAQKAALPIIADYRAIYVQTVGNRLAPDDTVVRHQASKHWLEQELSLSRRTTVVVTHHVPATGSIAERYQNNPLNPAFISRLDDMVADSGARVWIHGHTHTHFDYILGRTRVVCNPRGYPNELLDFDPGFVVEL